MITLKRLKEVLSYDEHSGEFTRMLKTGRKIVVGAIAGRKDRSKRNLICIDSKQYLAYRLAWLYVYGHWPIGEIDHINGNPRDDRIANLREASRTINQQNMREALVTNKAGALGVSTDNRKNRKYSARIGINNKTIFLGCFDTVEDAHNAYLKAKRSLHEGCTI